MPRKKIKEDVILVYNGVIYNSRFINYDESGSIISISLNKEGPKFLEIENDLIPNFINSKKDYKKYNIDYFLKIKQGLITDEDELDSLVRSEYIYFKVKENVNPFEVLISHNKKEKIWTVEFSNILESNIFSNFTFFVTKKDDKNGLIATYFIPDVSKKIYTLDFKTEIEEDFLNIDVLVYKKVKYYSLKEIK